MTIILTGDGGWAGLDRGLAAGLAARGIPSVGWSSLRYYWTPRTPDAAATDLARIIRHYMSEWAMNRVILVGYSFGADVLPFLVNRLPPSLRSHLRSVALLGLSDTADFEFHVSDWIGHGGGSRYRTVPEVERLNVPVLCVRGADEDESACRTLKGAYVTTLDVGRGHHFSGNYGQLVDAILNRTGRHGAAGDFSSSGLAVLRESCLIPCSRRSACSRSCCSVPRTLRASCSLNSSCAAV